MKSYSQYKQDEIIYNKYFRRNAISKLFLKEKKGFFIEIGADDGIDKSNTKLFEELGWEGICIEPSPTRFQMLIKNRNCECLNVAISNKQKEVEFLDITGYGKGLSGIVENYDPKHLERIKKETEDNPKTLTKSRVKVKTQRLEQILDERNIKRVDYCSIDVEGSEIEILKSINFKKVNFNIISIEDIYNNSEITQIMKDNYFKKQMRIGSDLVFKNLRN